jgi:hypothetical protein
MAPIRKLAGFYANNKMYFNTRTNVDVPDDLLRMTPISEWLYNITPQVLEEAGSTHPTCLNVLKFFAFINKVFIQDAAATMILYPERATHPIFREIPLFASTEYNVSFQYLWKTSLQVFIANTFLYF